MNNNDDEAMRVVDGGEVVETAEVKFVPLEDDFGFSGGEEEECEGYSDVEPVPVVLEEKVDVEDEGDGKDDDEDEDGGRGCYTEWLKRNMDKRKIEEVYEDMGSCSNEGTQKFVWDERLKAAKFWRGQVDVYEGKIVELMGKLDEVREGFMAARRMEAYQASEVKRLTKINLDRILDVERMRERCHRLAEDNCREERRHEAFRRNTIRRQEELQRELEAERRRNENVEKELQVTRRRLLTFTRRSIPRRNRIRLIRRVDSYEDGQESSVSIERNTSDEDNEECRVNKLIKIMDNF